MMLLCIAIDIIVQVLQLCHAAVGWECMVSGIYGRNEEVFAWNIYADIYKKLKVRTIMKKYCNVRTFICWS